MKLVLVRHGETEWNRLGKIQGTTDIPLNDNGIRIATITKEAYDKLGISYDVVYSSPLQRAITTAKILAPEHVIHVDERLHEISFGKYEGYSFEKLKSEAVVRSNIYRCFFEPDTYVADETGENYDEVLERISMFLKDMRETYTEDETILVVCHGGVIRGFLSVVLKQDLSKFWNSTHKNLCHTEIQWDKDGEFKVSNLAHYYYEL